MTSALSPAVAATANSPYRWVIFMLMALGSMTYMFMWMAPASLLTTIRSDLGVGLGQAGMLLTIIPLINGIFIFCGSLFVDKLGLKWASVLALSLMALGGMAAILASSFALLLASRVLIGIGAGLFSPTTGPLTVAWFPAREQPYVNTLITIMGSLGTSLAFVVTVPLLDAAGSWRLVLGLVALVPLALALAWVIGGRQAPAALAPHPQITVEEELRVMESGIAQAIKRREIVLLAVAVVGQVWVFNTLTTYLPSFFETVHGLDKIVAGSITGILPIAGIAGGLLCGTACGMSGRRRPFLWPLMFAMLVSALVVALLPPGPLVYLAIAVFGFASTGCSVPILTTSMDLPGTNPQLVGGAIAVIYGVAFILSFFASPLFGLVAPLMGMRTALVVFSLPLLISVAALYRIPETGPGSARAAGIPG